MDWDSSEIDLLEFMEFVFWFGWFLFKIVFGDLLRMGVGGIFFLKFLLCLFVMLGLNYIFDINVVLLYFWWVIWLVV